MNDGISEVPTLVTAGDPQAPRVGGRMRTWLRDLLISVVVSFFIITFLYQPVRVEGTSMAPRSCVTRTDCSSTSFSYNAEKIERDDVVVFYYPRDTQKSYIKRVIGLPGDTVRITEGRVFVNGTAIAGAPMCRSATEDVRSMDELHVPEGEYFVMGDHRSISSDSRDFGPVERNLIYGKAAFVYWPREEMGVVR